MKKNNHIVTCIAAILLLSMAIGCKKNNSYFVDSGVHDAQYNGTIFEYLQNHPYHQFDSLCKVVKLAGLENVLQNETVTFFATPDTMIAATISELNFYLRIKGKDTIVDLAQLKPEFWKKQLSMYIFRGEKKLKDYPQLDPYLLQTFPGQYYESLGGKKMLLGAIFNSAGGVSYAGYRQLVISYFTGSVPPSGLLAYPNLVASCDIKPRNGVIHALQWSNLRRSTGAPIDNSRYFGFSIDDVITDARQIGLDL